MRASFYPKNVNLTDDTNPLGLQPLGYGGAYYPQVGNGVGDPVDVTTGTFTQNHVDLHVNGPLPIEIKRTYSTQNKSVNDLGYGWLSSYPYYLSFSPDRSTIEAADGTGAVFLFRRNGNSNVWGVGLGDNAMVALGPGRQSYNPIEATITWDGGSTYTWNLPDGSTRVFTVQSFEFGPVPYLSRITDNRGNYLSFTCASENGYGRIARIDSSNGTSVAMSYVSFGLLSQVVASDGRTVNYGYSYIGDLTSVQLPDGQTYGYTYGKDTTGVVSSHSITQIHEPDGRLLVNVYDAQNRVVSQQATIGPGSAVQTLAAFDYSIPGQTTETDALGNPTVYQYSGNLITRIVDPLGNTITQTWYAAASGGGTLGPTSPPAGSSPYPNSLAVVTDKRGLQTSYQYDSQGNVTSTLLTGNLTGAGGSQTVGSTATYDALNRMTSSTDQSGITTYYAFSNPAYPYLPTQIATTKNGVPIRTDVLTYGTFGNPNGVFAAGLLAQRISASGSGQSVTNYSYNSAGFLTQKDDVTGTSDPDVVTQYAYTAAGELASIRDGDGRSTAYTYDAMSRPLTKTVSDEAGNVLGQWSTTYDGSGDVTQVVGPRTGPQNVESWQYDGGGRLIQDTASRIQASTDGSGVALGTAAVTAYAVDANGNVVTSTDPNGNVTTNSYDADGQLRSRLTAGTRTELFQYESGGNVSSYTNPLGGVTQKLYTSTGRLASQQNPDGSSLSWQYFTDGRLHRETLRNGSFWLVNYDDVARTVTRTLTRSDGATLATETDAYDQRGNLTSHTDLDGNTTASTYDGLNRMTFTSGPSSSAASAQETVTNSYGPSSKTSSVTDGLGEKVTSTFDALGRPVARQVADSAGNVVRSTAYVYTADNNAATATEGTGSTSISRTVYSDYSGRPLLTVMGDGSFSYNAYDPAGNLLSSTDALGQRTSYAYNGLNQAVSQTLPDGNVTTFAYDAAGNLLTRGMSGGSLSLQQTFDSAGRKVSEALFAGSTSTRQYSYSYYPSTSPFAGLLLSTTAPRDLVTVTYDSFLRPQSVTTSGGPSLTNSSTTYSYNNRGLATLVSQSSAGNAGGQASQVSRTYDGYGNVLTEQVTLGGQVVSNVSQAWDGAGRRASLNEASSTLSGPLFAYQHRADGLLGQVTSNGANYFFSYGDNGLLASRTNPWRSVTIDSRDPLGRAIQETTMVGGAAVMTEDMTWRANSTLATYSVAHMGTGAWNESRTYAYNARGQLVSEGYSPSAGVSSAVAYTFDGSSPGLGVRLDAKVGTGAPGQWEDSISSQNGFGQVTGEAVPGTSRTFLASGVALGADHVVVSVDGVSQGLASFPGWADPVGAWSMSLTLPAGTHTLAASAVHPSGQYTATSTSSFTVAGTPAGAVSEAFDSEGNVTARTWASGLSQALSWDGFGRLVKVSQRDGSGTGYDWTAAYDGLGRRIETIQQAVAASAASGAALSTFSTYDPQVEFLEIGVSLNGTKAWKLYGPDIDGRFGPLQGTGGLEAVIPNGPGPAQAVLSDQFGNGAATVSGGVLSWNSARVGAYGPVAGTQAAPLTDIGQLASAGAWRGRRIDPTGFYDLGARYYEPVSGRFLSADPMGQAASASLYDFAGGDPVNFFDPTGRCPASPDKFTNGLFKPTEVNTNTSFIDPGQGGRNPVDPNPSIFNGVVSAALDGGDRFFSRLLQDIVNTPQNLVDAAGSAVGGLVNLVDPGTRSQAVDSIAQDFKSLASAQTWANIGQKLLSPEGIADSVYAIDMGIAGSAVGAASQSSLAAETGAADSGLLAKYLNGSGGRWGSTATRLQNDSLATSLEDAGYQVTGGAGRAAEEWIPGAGGGTKGGTFVDLTATDGASTVRVQTISTLSSGAPTAAEAAAAARIRAAFPNDQLILVPKWP